MHIRKHYTHAFDYAHTHTPYIHTHIYHNTADHKIKSKKHNKKQLNIMYIYTCRILAHNQLTALSANSLENLYDLKTL